MKSRHRTNCGLAAAAAATLMATGAMAEGTEVFGERSPTPSRPVITSEILPVVSPLADKSQRNRVAEVELPAFDAGPFLQEDAATDHLAGYPYRYGALRDLDAIVTATNAGIWSRAADGRDLWTLDLTASSALGMRIHFSAIEMPLDGQLLVSGENGVDRYDNNGAARRGEFWAMVMQGETITIQYQAPLDSLILPRIEIDSIIHVYRDPFADPNGGPLAGLLPCHEDVQCHSPNAIARDSVCTYDFVDGGGALCTGALLADTDPNVAPGWFLTANHCVSTQAVANTITAYWFYQRDGCGGSIPSIFSVPRSNGAQLLAGSVNSDYSFLRLDEDPEDGQGLAGWSISTPSTNVNSIHHPGGSWKRVSLGHRTTQSPICGGLPTNRYWYVDWDDGMTEGGSSGGPLFNTSWQVVGQLFGACFTAPPACNNPSQWNAVFGRFNYSYLTGGLSAYLDTVIPDDIWEDNDTFETPSAIPPGLHEMRLVDLDDYIVLEFPTSGNLSVSCLFNTSDMDLDMTLRRADFSLLAGSWGNGNSETIDIDVEAGTYILQNWRDSGWGGDYLFLYTQTLDEVLCAADLDGSGDVGFADLVELLASWGPCPGCSADIDESGDVGFSDLVSLLAAWGPCV